MGSIEELRSEINISFIAKKNLCRNENIFVIKNIYYVTNLEFQHVTFNRS